MIKYLFVAMLALTVLTGCILNLVGKAHIWRTMTLEDGLISVEFPGEPKVISGEVKDDKHEFCVDEKHEVCVRYNNYQYRRGAFSVGVGSAIVGKSMDPNSFTKFEVNLSDHTGRADPKEVYRREVNCNGIKGYECKVEFLSEGEKRIAMMQLYFWKKRMISVGCSGPDMEQTQADIQRFLGSLRIAGAETTEP